MTDLERLRDALYRKGSSEKWWLEAIDTHLKEDAGLADWTTKIEAKLSKTLAELAELREAVRAHRGHECYDDRLRQLIEDKT